MLNRAERLAKVVGEARAQLVEFGGRTCQHANGSGLDQYSAT